MPIYFIIYFYYFTLLLLALFISLSSYLFFSRCFYFSIASLFSPLNIGDVCSFRVFHERAITKFSLCLLRLWLDYFSVAQGCLCILSYSGRTLRFLCHTVLVPHTHAEGHTSFIASDLTLGSTMTVSLWGHLSVFMSVCVLLRGCVCMCAGVPHKG